MPFTRRSGAPTSTSSVSPVGRPIAGSHRLAEQLEALRWDQHPLGPRAGWPAALQHTTALLLRSPQPMWLVWGAGRNAFVNDACALLMADAPVPGAPARDSWRDAWTQLAPQLDAVFATGAGTCVERVALAGETSLTFALSPVVGSAGNVEGVLAIVSGERSQRDVPAAATAPLAPTPPTREAAAHPDTIGLVRALSESTERLSASLTAAATGTFRWELGSDTMDLDGPLQRLLALVPGSSSLTLADFTRRVHPDDRPRFVAACEHSRRTGADFDQEFRISAPDGSVRWIADKGRAFFDGQGRPVYMTGACVDITKRKQSETFVWRQRDVLEQIVQDVPTRDVLETLTLDIEQISGRRLIVTVMLLDADGKLRATAGQRCPPEWSRLVDGIAPAAHAGSFGAAVQQGERVIVTDVTASPLWTSLVTEALRHGFRACTATPIITSGGHVLGTFVVYDLEPGAPTDEELRMVDIVARTAAIVLERDRAQIALRETQAQLADYARTLEQRVSERTAKLQETVSELEAFSYSISHDMRAPLRAMQSFAQILAEECSAQIGPEGKDYIRRIIGASDRMDRLIQDVLTYSKVTRNELPLAPVDVEPLLDGILESYPQFNAPRASITIVRPLPRVLGNEAALTQCFSNLIGNAIKFVPPGTQPEIRIWAEQADGRVRLFVRDNGIGIEPGAHEKIFHIFYQLDRSFEGTGIGLSVVRKAAERMGGNVGVTSEPGKGSTFHLELNVAP